jgi:hypothetical protein
VAGRRGVSSRYEPGMVGRRTEMWSKIPCPTESARSVPDWSSSAEGPKGKGSPAGDTDVHPMAAWLNSTVAVNLWAVRRISGPRMPKFGLFQTPHLPDPTDTDDGQGAIHSFVQTGLTCFSDPIRVLRTRLRPIRPREAETRLTSIPRPRSHFAGAWRTAPRKGLGRF